MPTINIPILNNFINSFINFIIGIWNTITSSNGVKPVFQYNFFALLLALCIGKIILNLFNKLR